MAKDYFFQIGSGDPRPYTGLSPTFLIFQSSDGTTLTPPGVTERITGSSGTGFYQFSYAPNVTLNIAFLLDGGATLSSSIRYITGSIDAVQAVDQQAVTIQAIATTLIAIGTTNAAVGNTLSSLNAIIGTTASSFGSTSTDPGDVMGYLKRLQEWNEGDSVFTKGSGVWDVYSRGSSTLLREKTITDDSTSTDKS